MSFPVSWDFANQALTLQTQPPSLAHVRRDFARFDHELREFTAAAQRSDKTMMEDARARMHEHIDDYLDTLWLLSEEIRRTYQRSA